MSEWDKFCKPSVLRTADGKTYKILNCNATCDAEKTLDLDSMLIMDENGKANIALHFEPVPMDTKNFDYDEDCGGTCKRIWGIQKDAVVSEIPEEWKNVQYAENEMLLDAVVEKKNATVKIKMMGFRKGMWPYAVVEGFSMRMGEFHSIIEEYNVDGDNAEVTFDIPIAWSHTIVVYIQDVLTMRNVLIAPGETVDIIVDLYAKENPVAVKGFMAKTNMELANINMMNELVDFNMIENATKDCGTSAERIAAIDKMCDDAIAKVNNMEMTDAAKAIMRMSIECVESRCVLHYAEIIASNRMIDGELGHDRYEAELAKLQSDIDPKDVDKYKKEKMSAMESVTAKHGHNKNGFFKSFHCTAAVGIAVRPNALKLVFEHCWG